MQDKLNPSVSISASACHRIYIYIFSRRYFRSETENKHKKNPRKQPSQQFPAHFAPVFHLEGFCAYSVNVGLPAEGQINKHQIWTFKETFEEQLTRVALSRFDGRFFFRGETCWRRDLESSE